MYVPPHCAVLVWNREWFLRELGEYMNIFTYTNSTRGARKKQKYENSKWTEQFFCLRSK